MFSTDMKCGFISGKSFPFTGTRVFFHKSVCPGIGRSNGCLMTLEQILLGVYVKELVYMGSIKEENVVLLAKDFAVV